MNYLGKYTLPTGNDDKTFAFSKGPIFFKDDRLYCRGHAHYPNFAECPLPEPNTVLKPIRWFDPTDGVVSKFDSDYRSTHPGSQKITLRSLYLNEDGLLQGFVNLFYNANVDHLNTFYLNKSISKTNLHPQKVAGPSGILPKSLQTALGAKYWCFYSTPQGIASTNNGPALYVFNTSSDIRPIFEYSYSNPYPGWHGSQELTDATFTDTHLIYTFRKSIGATWYGNNNKTTQSILYPGQIAVDEDDNLGQGYHSEKHKLTLLVISIKNILNNKVVFEEIYPPQIHRSGRANIGFYNGRLYLHEGLVGHIFQTYTEEQMREIEVLKSELAKVEEKIKTHRDVVTELDSIFSDLQSKMEYFGQKLAQLKISIQ